MAANRRARRVTSPWLPLVGALGLGALALACEPADPCARTGVGVLCFDLPGARTYTWGLPTGVVGVADLDADGHPDLVGTGDARGAVGVVWGRAKSNASRDMFDGTATSWSIGAGTQGLAIADLDGDGRLDVATALPQSGEIAVLRGRGGRVLAEPERIAVGLGPRRIVALDFDAAGPPELVVVNETDGTVTILRHLVADPPVSVGAGARDVAGADLDGDGDLDLAVAVAEEGAIQVLLGDGRGGFELGARHPVGLAPTTVVAADLDADGAVDLATLDVLDDAVTILLGDGQARLRARARWPVEADPIALAVAPGDDGAPDLYVLSEKTANVQRVDPRRGVDRLGTVTERPTRLLVGDLHGDGRDALLYLDRSNGLGEFTSDTGLRVDRLWQRQPTGTAFPVDLDADGVDELLIDLDEQPEIDPPQPDPSQSEPDPSQPRPRVLAVARGAASLDLALDSGLPDRLQGATAADFDGDGRNDLMVWSRRELSILVARPDGSFAPGVPGLEVGEARYYAVVRGADRARLVFATTNALVVVGLGPDGAPAVEAPITLDRFVSGLSTVDLEGDGRIDLVVHLSDSLVVFEDLQLDAPRSIDRPELAGGGALLLVAGDGDGRDALVCADQGLVHVADLFGPEPGPATVLDPEECERLAAFDLDADGRRTEVISLRGDSQVDGVQRVVLTPWHRDDHEWRSLAPRAVASVGGPRWIGRGGGRLALLREEATGELVAEDMSLGPALGARPRTRFGYPFTPSLGDFDGDGTLDLFVHSGTYGGPSVEGFAFGDGDGGFGPTELRRQTVNGATVEQAAVLQLDDDPADELVLVLGSPAGGSNTVVRLDLEDGERRPRPLVRFPAGANVNLLTGDFDGDGRSDLLAYSFGSAPLAGQPVGPAPGLAGTTYRTAFLRRVDDGLADARWGEVGFSYAAWGGLQRADLDGDGRLDLLAVSGSLEVAAGLGDARFAPGRLWSLLGPNDFAVGDLDRDGRPEMAAVIFNYESPIKERLVLLRGGATAGSLQPIFDGGRSVDLGDLDGDGELELLVLGSDGAFHVGQRGGAGFRFDRYPLPGVYGALRARDVDGDGRRDITFIGSGAVTLVRQVQ
ncbi:FG-GAP repeat domain-containing protein [Nannocystis punicea]|uniref:VCBS repeat-containing protein n=1 Tax=Nannocystis punicea TaxID=2995304 RepID=A0ABY7HIX5_9BACT|nr:VCBS repeat-containing protein [Nannocystis poenicansa]WAS98899.1 VCBS repeat-containing protein [Nannocystis poenicansa]